jgi:hypothetical protein
MIKVDGLCIAVKGKEFLTVDHLKSELEELYQVWGWTFFDGELYVTWVGF